MRKINAKGVGIAAKDNDEKTMTAVEAANKLLGFWEPLSTKRRQRLNCDGSQFPITLSMVLHTESMSRFTVT